MLVELDVATTKETQKDGRDPEVEAEELYASKDVLIKKMTKDLSKALGCLKDM